jgi:hypothetical protein
MCLLPTSSNEIKPENQSSRQPTDSAGDKLKYWKMNIFTYYRYIPQARTNNNSLTMTKRTIMFLRICTPTLYVSYLRMDLLINKNKLFARQEM